MRRSSRRGGIRSGRARGSRSSGPARREVERTGSGDAHPVEVADVADAGVGVEAELEDLGAGGEGDGLGDGGVGLPGAGAGDGERAGEFVAGGVLEVEGAAVA